MKQLKDLKLGDTLYSPHAISEQSSELKTIDVFAIAAAGENILVNDKWLGGWSSDYLTSSNLHFFTSPESATRSAITIIELSIENKQRWLERQTESLIRLQERLKELKNEA